MATLSEKDLPVLASGKYPHKLFILVILQVACALAALAHPSHIVIYAPGDSQACRLPATRII
ncbi:hypothetical protein D3I61_11255 [Escherichia coli]|nr:hypothetical protein D3I61_11255 [Escherichia coli]